MGAASFHRSFVPRVCLPSIQTRRRSTSTSSTVAVCSASAICVAVMVRGARRSSSASVGSSSRGRGVRVGKRARRPSARRIVSCVSTTARSPASFQDREGVGEVGVSPSPYGIVICGRPLYAALTHSSPGPISCALPGVGRVRAMSQRGLFKERFPSVPGVAVCGFADAAGVGAADDDLPQLGAGGSRKNTCPCTPVTSYAMLRRNRSGRLLMVASVVRGTGR